MGVLIDRDTSIIIQGITGKQGSYHALQTINYGANLVAGVTPGKGGQTVHGVPVYDLVSLARESHHIDASLILVPPPQVFAAGQEAIANGIRVVVIITEHVPIHDTMRLKSLARSVGVTLVGPNTIGVISPGRSKVGIMPGSMYRPGDIAIVSRSGTLCHEIASNLAKNGVGQSTCIGIGGDLVRGLGFVDSLRMFETDDETGGIVLVDEIGGTGAEDAARLIAAGYKKPVYAFVAGTSAPPGKKMGHAGAILRDTRDSAASKKATLKEAGARVFDSIDEMVACIADRHRDRT
ncbi:MAG: succinate--CoA ligase subunit alpha [Firmicutes bacterium]|nr:succinate--CoA ligase subunit alpha [Bacillota bacterium]